MTSLFRPARPIVLVALMALGSAACGSTGGASAAPPQQADLSQEITAKASVVSVDRAQRVITLRGEDGGMFSVEAGPAVHNFDQIAVGDQLNVRYRETLTATLRPAGDIATSADAVVAAGRAAQGQQPAAGVLAAITVRVKIESVDRASHIVVFSPASGELRTVRASRPEGRAFVDTLKVGDIVQLDYSVSLALAIEKL